MRRASRAHRGARVLAALGVLAGLVSLPGRFGPVGTSVFGGWVVAMLIGWLGWPVGARAWQRWMGRLVDAAVWPVFEVITVVMGVVQLVVRPRSLGGVAMLGLAWNAHRRLVQRQLRRADRDVVRYAAHAHHPPGFVLACVERLASEEWSYDDETAAWDALGACHDADLLHAGIAAVAAWIPPPRRGRGGACRALAENPCLTLAHVAATRSSVANAVWHILEPAGAHQGRDLVSDAGYGEHPLAVVHELCELVHWAETGDRLDRYAVPFEPLHELLAEHASGRVWFIPVLRAVLVEEHASGEVRGLAAALERVFSLGAPEVVAKLLGAGASGAVEELDEVATSA